MAEVHAPLDAQVGVDLDRDPERRVDREVALACAEADDAPIGGGLDVVEATGRQVDADGPRLLAGQGVHERIFSSAVEGHHDAVGAARLVDWPASHLFVDVALVDDDRVAHPTRGRLDRADLVARLERTGHLLGDVQGRAVGRQGVVVEGALKLDDPRRVGQPGGGHPRPRND